LVNSVVIVTKMYVIRSGAITHTDTITHSLESIPERIRKDIQRHRNDEDYEIPKRLLRPGGAGGHLAHAFQQILYSLGLNGGKEVEYQKDKGIKISVDGVYALQDVLRG